MGYDITLHPIKKEEINYFVIEPFFNRSLIDKRIRELSKDDEEISFLKETYNYSFKDRPSSRFYKFKRMLFGQYNDCLELSNLSAKVASYLHPYWYSRNICLSFLVEDNLCKPMFQPLSYCAEDAKLVTKFRHEKLYIQYNYRSSGYAKSDDIAYLADNLIPSIRKKAKDMEDKKLQSSDIISNLLVDEETLWGIKQALAYCKKHKLGLIEVSDIVIPITDSFSCNPHNFNAYFYNKNSEGKDEKDL